MVSCFPCRGMVFQQATKAEAPGGLPLLWADCCCALSNPAHSSAGGQGDFDSPVLRLSYTSLTTPASVRVLGLRAVFCGQPRVMQCVQR